MLPVAPTTRTVAGGVIMTKLSRRRLVEDAQPIERARVADERDELGEDIDQPASVVADIEVRGDVPLDLRFASAERDEHGEGEQFAGLHVETSTGEVVAEAVRRQVLLDVDSSSAALA